MRILGHRGASADAVENTLEAFRLALAQGADGVELDARLCGTGELVVFHDDTLERLAGRPGRVADTPWSTLRTLELGPPGKGPRPRVPLLEEVLDGLPRSAEINVELKADGAGVALAKRAAQMLEAGGHADHVLVSSFHPFCLAVLGARGRSLRRGYLLDPDRPYWLEAGLLAPLVGRDAVHPADGLVTEARVRAWHRHRKQVTVWTVDDPERARLLRSWGVDGVITNRPGMLRAALGGSG